MDRDYELKLQGDTKAIWTGSSPEDAARRYVDCHRDQIVIAWREPHQTGTVAVLGRSQIIEPGHSAWGSRRP